MNLVTVIKVFLYFFLSLFIIQNSHSNVIYEKNNLIITEIDIKIYQKLYLENYNSRISKTDSLKDLVLINNLIKNLEKNNAEFLNKIDTEILSRVGEDYIKNEGTRNFLRFSRIRDEFIINYFQNKLNLDEVFDIFSSLDFLNLPVSIDNCLIIKEIVDLKNNKEFIKSFYENLKKNKREFQITIDEVKHQVCINETSFRTLEKLIVDYIQIKTAKQFEKFVYEKTKN